MTSAGEEATAIGSAAALSLNDTVSAVQLPYIKCRLCIHLHCPAMTSWHSTFSGCSQHLSTPVIRGR